MKSSDNNVYKYYEDKRKLASSLRVIIESLEKLRDDDFIKRLKKELEIAEYVGD